ncbi:hypothetical protein [Palleronia pelagia]|uniref:Uncharacterized protein n=1 Tax=Palleronia pelagia TaxID=387096 RepID=A0A1H8J3Y7_9RHOB|nr:hypothetical protein [Palleronia pelagia]SEN74678.1 hypothetical protein SAMN04488011_10632 [Palleronia pelagia]
MAKSTKGAGNILGPIFLVGAAALIAIVAVFAMSDETPPDEPTIIAEDDISSRPAGAGTNPEGERDMETEGITDELDEVDPAAPGQETVPPAEAEDPLEPIEDSETPQPAPDDESDTQTESSATIADDEFIVDESSDSGADRVEDASDESFPDGRDTETELTPEEDQSVVRDTDSGGTGFVPTPSGPEGRDDETIAE